MRQRKVYEGAPKAVGPSKDVNEGNKAEFTYFEMDFF
jgi:hypothetical protein